MTSRSSPLLLDGADAGSARRRRRPRSGSVTIEPGDHGAVVGPASTISAFEQHGLEVADAGLHLALLLLGGVVVAVLREVAELAGRSRSCGRCRCGRGWSGPRARPSGGRRWPGRGGGRRPSGRGSGAERNPRQWPARRAPGVHIVDPDRDAHAPQVIDHSVAHADARRALLDRPPRWAVFSFSGPLPAAVTEAAASVQRQVALRHGPATERT